MSDETIMTPREAAEFLQISLSKLYELLKKDNPPPRFMVGQQPRFLKSSLIEWLRESPHQ